MPQRNTTPDVDPINGPNPSGLCMCGCGEHTKLARKTDLGSGRVKNTPVRYVLGHSPRKDRSGLDGPNPSGLCKCGCGQMTAIATLTNTKRGWVQGTHKDYVNGHGKRIRSYTVDPGTGCWNWDSPRYGSGYVNITEDGRTVGVHRYMWEKMRGPIPDHLVLDHLCRNPHCVNPNHLEPVEVHENTRRGLKTKIDRHTAAQIKLMLRTNPSPSAVARRIGVTTSIVKNIKQGLAWRDVSSDEAA